MTAILSPLTSLNVALEVSTLCEAHRSGTGRYAISLIEALEARTDVCPKAFLYRLSRWKRRKLRYRPERSRWYIEGLPPPLALGCSLVHGTDVRVPHWSRLARVVTLHDVFHVLPFSLGWSSPEFRERSQMMYARLVRDADVIISDSTTTRNDFLQNYQFPPERVVVIPLGVDPVFAPRSAAEIVGLRQRLGLARPYVLHVGALVTRKNLPRLVEAFARAGLAKDFDLVLAGGGGDANQAVEKAIAATGLTERVKLISYIAEGDLPVLYAGAAALAFPSLYEGFGLPALEAMASGVPVVTSDRGASAEIASTHAVLIDPADTASLADGLVQALAMDDARRQAARAHAGTFTWASTAEATVQAYRQALALRGMSG